MMWEFKSKVMVMLCRFTEEGHKACHPFWPSREGESAQYGHMVVTFQSETDFGGFITRKLFVKEEQMLVCLVCHMHCSLIIMTLRYFSLIVTLNFTLHCPACIVNNR